MGWNGVGVCDGMDGVGWECGMGWECVMGWNGVGVCDGWMGWECVTDGWGGSV